MSKEEKREEREREKAISGTASPVKASHLLHVSSANDR